MKIGIKLGMLLAATAIAGAAGAAVPAVAYTTSAAVHMTVPRLSNLSGYLYDGYGLRATSANLSTGTNYTVTNGTPNSRYHLGGTTGCGTGYVTDGCPFTQGLNINATDKGKEIIQWYSVLNGSKCIGANDRMYMVVKDCPGGSNDYGTYWVWLKANEFVNVAATNATGEYNVQKVMCAQLSSPSYVDAEVWRANNCWWDAAG